MKRLLILIWAAFACCAHIAPAAAPQWHFEYSGGKPSKLVWQTEAGRSYDLFQSADLSGWTHVAGYPMAGTGGAIEHSFALGTRGFFRITSESPNESDGYVLIPASSFLMGDQSSPLVGWYDELPVHSVKLGAFYMAKYEVTKELWDTVRAWGLANGYTDLPAGNGTYASKGANHPVHNISWHAMVRWCNARSEKENLTPCYRVSGAIYKTAPDNNAVTCDFGANGYRLPTEAEWEKAARGGLTGLNFPWGNTISHSQANYFSNSSGSYDVSPTRGYHPIWSNNDDGNHPYTSRVGSFAPNGYGLYDMSGNLWEWCWDWYWDSYYSSSPGTDPSGPASGSYRVSRGGSWGDEFDDWAGSARCAYRNGLETDFSFSMQGFRPARSSVP